MPDFAYPPLFLRSTAVIIGTATDYKHSFEGGWWPGGPADPNPTFRGVRQDVYTADRAFRSLPLQSVKLATYAELLDIYYRKYWLPSNAGALTWIECLLYLDCAINCGLTRAKTTLERGPTPATFLNERERFYRALVAKKPYLAPDLPGWEKRVTTLRQLAGVTV